MTRREPKRRVTHCPKGHGFTEGNTYNDPAGKRRCRQCQRDDTARRRASYTLSQEDRTFFQHLLEKDRSSEPRRRVDAPKATR
jgi:hypothetical protein